MMTAEIVEAVLHGTVCDDSRRYRIQVPSSPFY